MEMTVTLDRLCPGQSARIIDTGGEDAMRRRLIDLGFTKDTEIHALYTAASGDPTAYLVRGTVIALRASDASNILAVPSGG